MDCFAEAEENERMVSNRVRWMNVSSSSLHIKIKITFHMAFCVSCECFYLAFCICTCWCCGVVGGGVGGGDLSNEADI